MLLGLFQNVNRKVQKAGKVEHHLWKKRESAGSGQKAMNLVRIISGLGLLFLRQIPRNLFTYRWETEFPLIAAAKALRILRQRRLWKRVIQVFADMEELGVKPDEDTVRRVARAFQMLGQEDKQKLVLKRDEYYTREESSYGNFIRIEMRNALFYFHNYKESYVHQVRENRALYTPILLWV
ncbi:hypothetical protein BC332_04343 [Capsicum chinense]|nr:hypothetical protein BC332_04343 [Capsicum chinense]